MINSPLTDTACHVRTVLVGRHQKLRVHVKVVPMGSAQSYISSEIALTTLVVAGAIGLGYTQIGRSSIAAKSSTDAPQSDNLKGKKKRAKSSVVFSGDFLDKGHPNNDKPQQHLATPHVLNPLPGFPGQFEPTTLPDSHLSDLAATSSSLSKAKKSKKKKAKAVVTTDPVVREVTASSSADYSSEISNKSRTKNLKRQPQPQSSSSQTTVLLESTASIDTDESWTRVGSVRRHTPLSKDNTASFDATTSDADTGLTPQTGSSSPIAERGTEGEESSSFLLDIGSRESGENPRKTLAEKLLPKPRRTGVDELSFQPPCLAGINSANNNFSLSLICTLRPWCVSACLKRRITPP